MYQPGDTIAAVSTPTSSEGVIVRISGPGTFEILRSIFSPSIPENRAGLFWGKVAIGSELQIDAGLYLFLAGHSYTGEVLGEIHIHTNSSVTEALLEYLFSRGLRMAGPGEFTARGYLNGKIDLAQAEAVNEIVVSSNKYQLAAAEKLLSGKLAESTEKICSSIIDCLSLIEAGMDFSGEEIEYIASGEMVERLTGIKGELEQLLASSISCESVIDLPSVGIAGAPNAGKSSLLNRLLGRERSIVSEQRKTTRDVLTGLLRLEHCRCVLFDCAGLIQSPKKILDELTQQAAIEALRNSSAVIFCVDISKAEYSEDISIRALIESTALIPMATKSDLVSKEILSERIVELNEIFDAEFVVISSMAGTGVELLQEAIDGKIIQGASGSIELTELGFGEVSGSGVALTVRHRQVVTEAIASIDESIDELKSGNDEVSAMMLRAAYQAVSNIEQHNVDEQILENIFSRFCIGK